jgi:uncharacterized protein (DUF2267 family)
MSYEHFIEQIQERSGFAGPAEAARAVDATLSALRERLVDDEAGALAQALPEPMAQILRRGAYDCDFGLDELYRRAGEREGVPLGFATEHTQVVCQVLAETIGAELLRRLQQHLPGDLAALLTSRPPLAEPPEPERRPREIAPGAGATLAEGRPGSRHPLSEAHPDKAQQHSVARSADPHGDTKLSSSRGLTQERLEETLAGGHPGSARPLHSAKR